MRLPAIILAVTVALASAPAAAQAVLSPDDMRAATVAAYNQGALEQAAEMAAALIARDPQDRVGLSVGARIALERGQVRTARALAARLWRAEGAGPDLRFDAARIAAVAAAQEGRLTVAQLWLRRGATVAPNAEAAAALAADYRDLRAANPLSFRLSFGLSPSDNVNGGSESAFNVIDGFPIVGELSPDARALSGWAGHVDVDLAYRLQGDAQSRTEAGLRLWARGVWLSREARDFIEEEQDPDDPPITNRDFGSAAVTARIGHRRAIGPVGAGVEFSFGRAFSAGAVDYDMARLTLTADLPAGTAGAIGLSAWSERRFLTAGGADEDRQGLSADWRRSLGAGTVSAGATLTRTLSPSPNRASEAVTLSAGYAADRPVGPFEWAVNLGVQRSVWPDYRVIFPVPGGRTDDRVFADLTLTAPGLSRAGFSPQVRIGWDRVDSNVSRFARDGLTVEFGLRSDF